MNQQEARDMSREGHAAIDRGELEEGRRMVELAWAWSLGEHWGLRFREREETYDKFVALYGVRSRYGGWPMVGSKAWPGELTLACGTCKSTDIVLTTERGGTGTAPGGRWRMGDPGGRDLALCKACGAKGYPS